MNLTLANIRKLIAYVVGMIVLGLSAFLGIGDGQTFFGMPVDQVVNVVIGILTGLGIYRATNDPAPPKS